MLPLKEFWKTQMWKWKIFIYEFEKLFLRMTEENDNKSTSAFD